MTDAIFNAPFECSLCPRLVKFRNEINEKHPNWFNGAVPSFGDPKAEIMIVGLAPGLKGANRTGRPFTGDYAGDLLYKTLAHFGLSKGTYDMRPDDGLLLKNLLICNSVRCVPPQNKPTTSEINTCRPYMMKTIEEMGNVKILIALGRIAHDSVLTGFNLKKSAFKFGHNQAHQITDNLVLIDSYHCSRYNTNTGRLTEAMFFDVFENALARV